MCDIVEHAIYIVKCYEKAIKHEEASHCLHMRRFQNNATESKFYTSQEILRRKYVNEGIIVKQCTTRCLPLLWYRRIVTAWTMKCEWQTENPCSGTFPIRSQIIIFRHVFIIASIEYGQSAERFQTPNGGWFVGAFSVRRKLNGNAAWPLAWDSGHFLGYLFLSPHFSDRTENTFDSSS